MFAGRVCFSTRASFREALERAHAAEGLGRRAEAIAAYQTVLDAWKHADPEFRKYMDDATAGLRRLRGGSLQ